MFKCTVAIPIYNRKDMIDDTLRSVLDQDYPDIEILLIDDCSDDGVWEKLQSYNDPRIRLIRNATNIGLFANFNKCLSLSRGRFIRILCNDDRLNTGCIRRECEFMDSNPNVALLNSAAQIVGCSDKILGHTGQDISEGIYKGHEAIRKVIQGISHHRNPLSCPSAVMIRASLVNKYGLRFDEKMKMAGDYSFFLNTLEYGDLAVFHTVGAVVKVHPDSAGFKQKRSSIPFAEMIDVTMRYFPELFNESERQKLLGDLAGKVYGYAMVWYLRGYRVEANDMFNLIAPLCADNSVRIKSTLRYLSREFYTRLRKYIQC